METLTEDAKKLIELQCRGVLEQYRDALREVQIYKWAARSFFAVVLGGSIVGFFQIQDYLDERITRNTSNLEHLFYAKSLSDTGEMREALPELLEFARFSSVTPLPQSVPSSDSRNLFGDFAKSGPAIRTYFFLSLLEVLSSIPNDSSADPGFGRVEWQELLKNTRFRADILDNPRWTNDDRVLMSLGHAHAKFAADKAELVEAKAYFQKLRRYATIGEYKATANFVLGVYSLADNEITQAADYFQAANAAKPKWMEDDEDYFASSDPLYWVRLFPSREEFKARYVKAYDVMESKPTR